MRRVPFDTVHGFEGRGAQSKPEILAKLTKALKAAGVVFIEPDDRPRSAAQRGKAIAVQAIEEKTMNIKALTPAGLKALHEAVRKVARRRRRRSSWQ